MINKPNVLSFKKTNKIYEPLSRIQKKNEENKRLKGMKNMTS